jgi:hypothetical protein
MKERQHISGESTVRVPRSTMLRAARELRVAATEYSRGWSDMNASDRAMVREDTADLRAVTKALRVQDGVALSRAMCLDTVVREVIPEFAYVVIQIILGNDELSALDWVS